MGNLHGEDLSKLGNQIANFKFYKSVKTITNVTIIPSDLHTKFSKKLDDFR